MLPLDPSELESVRSDIQALMTTSVTIKRGVKNKDRSGGGRMIHSSSTTTVCNMYPSSRGRDMTREETEAERKSTIVDWVVCFPYGTVVGHKDILEVNGMTLEVQGTNAERTDAFQLGVNARVVG